MKLSDIGELPLIEYIGERFQREDRRILLGIGDDAAVIGIKEGKLLATTDTMVEGVHFDMLFSSAYQLGYKLVSINVSDIYAMGGDPAYALLNLSLPSAMESKDADELLRGIAAALDVYNAVLVGGDVTSSKSSIVLTCTMLGFCTVPVTRKGAKPGDRIYVTGPMGDSACGLELLKHINHRVYIEREETTHTPLGWDTLRPLVTRHLMPTVKKPPFEPPLVTSMMDVSDGLFIDLKKLCKESKVGARIYEERLPVSPELVRAAVFLDKDPLHLCICGGEDYEYLFTARAEVDGAICIGEIIEEGFVFVDKMNRQRKWLECGYEHFKQ